jgi:nucleoside-diphosphate-sugar epimerase
MMNKKVLIFGKSSFVASGIDKVLAEGGYEVDFFTRGEEGRFDNLVYGKISEILENKFFCNQYDSIINYVVLKDAGVKENIEFIQALLEFSVKCKVKKLVHFSSIMVYGYKEKNVNEFTSVEPSEKTYKKGYGEIKIAVDEFILSVKDKYPIDIILVRPGYVLDDSRACPFVKNLPFGFNLIKGNRKSKQPIVRKESIHKAILQILSSRENLSVYHFFPNIDQTKYQYTKEKFGGIIMVMPEFIFRIIPLWLTKLGVFPKSLYSRFEGMYIKTVFSSEKTEEKLHIKF